MMGRFAWQVGCGPFSYAKSQVPAVIRYLQNQDKHHVKKTFRQEYEEFLQKFGIDYHPQYLFKSIDE